MSLFSSLISVSASCLAEPLSALCHFYSTTQLLQNPVAIRALRNETCQKADQTQRVVGIALNRIQQFITSLGIESNKISCLVLDNASPCSVQGSLLEGGVGLLYFNQQTVASIEKEFTPTHKFIVAHELGHLIHDDQITGILEITKKSCRIRIIAYAVIILGLNYFSSYTLLKKHLISSLFAKLVGRFRSNQLFREKEYKADSWAAKQSLELARAGADDLQKNSQATEIKIKALITNWEGIEQSCHSPAEKLLCKVTILILKIIGCVNWDSLHYFSAHPSFSSRAINVYNNHIQ